MPKFVTALFDEPDEALEAIEALKEIGIPGSDIQYVDHQRQREGFFQRLFLDENGDKETGTLRVMGIERRQVEHLASHIREGSALVIAMCDPQRERQVHRIFSKYSTVDIEDLPRDREAEQARRKRGAVEPGVAETESPKKWFHVVDIDEEDTRRGARSHAVHVHTAPDVPHISSDQMPGAQPKTPFDRFEKDFRVHYRENFDDTRHSFSDYALAYRFGMTLAENRRLRQLNWEALERAAKRGWEDNTHGGSWDEFKEAVHFGWRTARHFHRRREGRRR